MDFRSFRYITSLLLILVTMSGCSIRLVTKGTEDKRLRSLPHRDLSEMSLNITSSPEDPNSKIISQINNSKIELLNPCRIKYDSLYFDLIGLVAVKGTLPPNDKKYTVLLDTGHPGCAILNSLTILDNDFSICPLGESDVHSSYMGFCELPSLQLGQALITNPPCIYLQQQWEVQIFGLPIWQQRGVLLGLGSLKDFSYITFDNIHKEIELSATEKFIPDKIYRWDHYPFEIKDGQLIVSIPIEGKNCPLMFDTCGRYGLIVAQDFLERLPIKSKPEDIRDSTFQSGFLGQLPCKRTTIKKLNMGSLCIKNAETLILPEDSPYIETAYSISMKFFKKHVVVLDFKSNSMWIKKQNNDFVR